MTLRSKAISLLGLLAFSATTVVAETKFANFNNAFNDLLQTHQLPGAVVMIKHQGELIHQQAYGKVNVEKPELMEQEALFRIYSMSKPITAVALLQLVDKGLVKLDADIRDYLPDFEPFEYEDKQQRVTIHHLLSHTAGFGYGGGLKNWVDIRYLLANPLSRNNTSADMIDDISGIDLKFAPGERFEYSIASDIQGAIVEAVSNMPLDEYLNKYLFTPS